MRISLSKWLTLVVAVWFTVALSGCGGGGGDTMGGNPSEPPTLQPGPLPPLLNQKPGNARNAPVAYDGRSLNVNPGIAPAPGSVPAVREHHGVGVAYGVVRDGVGDAHLIEYLREDAQSNGRVGYFGIRPPMVQIVEGAAPGMIDQAVRAVQLINAALPPDWRLEVEVVTRESVAHLDEPVVGCIGLECLDAPNPGGYEYPSQGNIIVQFATGEDWSGFGGPASDPSNAGRADLVIVNELIEASRVWVDPVRAGEDAWLSVLVHEILHSLGRNHPDPERFQSIMRATYELGNPGAAIFPLDREALLAVYGVLGPYATPRDIVENLGQWEDTSIHVQGLLDAGEGEMAFGVALRNGLARPWASGPGPSVNLEDNQELSGSATWSGRLLGFTPATEVVVGAADLTIQLDSLDGALDFTALESWAAGREPGAVGTGTRWGDGDLNYEVRVSGNTFSRTGGDDSGEVTGAFFGGSHEAIGGVVERDDLTAGFGGKR